MHTVDTRKIAQDHGLCQDRLLVYFHRLHQARQVADLQGEVILRREAGRVKGKILFLESLGEQV